MKNFSKKKAFIVFVQAAVWLQILSFVTYLAYPTPANIYKNVHTWLRGLPVYHDDIQNIFYIYSFICILSAGIFFYKKKNNFAKWFFVLLGFFTFWYGYSATRGYTWYFYSGDFNNDRTNKLIAASVIMFIFSFLLYCKQTKRIKFLNPVFNNKIYSSCLFIAIVLLYFFQFWD